MIEGRATVIADSLGTVSDRLARDTQKEFFEVERATTERRGGYHSQQYV